MRKAVKLSIFLGSFHLVPFIAGRAQDAARTPGAVDSTLLRADSVYQRSDWPAAAAAYSAIVRRDTMNALAWFRLGRSLEQQGQLREAIAPYQRSVRVAPRPLPAYLALAGAQVRLGDREEAFKNLRTAAALGFPPQTIDTNPAFESIRTSPEYVAIRSQAEAVRYPCRSVHTFDFWAGTFDVTPWDQPLLRPASSTINTRDYDGCVIVEHFNRQTDPLGMSMSFYDINRHVWRMVWNDNQNQSNDFEGSFRDGAMRFLGWVLDPQGHRIMASNTLMAISPDTVRQTYSLSFDGGKTWVIQGSNRYVRRN